MKHFLLFILTIVFSYAGIAQPWQYEFVNTLGGTDGSEYPVEIVMDENGDLIHAGNFTSSSVNIGSNVFNHGNPGMEYGNAYLAGYNSDGTVKWAKGLIGDRSVDIQFLKNASDNSNYVVGRFTSDSLFYDNNLVLSDSVYGKSFILNVNQDGSLNYAKKLKATATFSGNIMNRDVMVDGNSDLYFAGHFSGDTLIIPGEDTLKGNNEDNTQMLLGKYDSQGNLQWAFTDKVSNNTYSGTTVKSFDMDSNSDLLVGGLIEDGIESVIGDDTLKNIGNNDLLLAKFGQNGNPLWAKNYGTVDNEEILDVASDDNNNVFVLGKFTGDTLDIGGQYLSNDTSGSFAAQYFIGKFNSTGSLQWMKKAGVSDSYKYNQWSIKTDSTDLYLMSSFVDSTLNFGNINLEGHGKHDMLVAKFDGSGNAMWAQNFGGYQDDEWFDYEMGSSTMFLTGNLDGEMIFGLDTINQSGLYGYFTAQIDLSSGNVLDVKADTTSKVSYQSDFEVSNMELGDNGALFMSGGFSAAGIELDNKTLSYFGGKDVFIAKQSRNYAISGLVYDYLEQTVTSGMVYLYKMSSSGPFTVMDSVSIDSEAYYTFQNLDYGKYIVKAVPNSNDYPSLMSAYYDDAATWKNALVINTERGSNHNANIYLMEDPENTGNASVQGTITEENTKITKSTEEVTGEPVKGVSVILKGKKKADKDMYDLVRTNDQGVYKFANVNTGNYEIVCDYPGMEQAERYEIEVSDDKETYENYDYVMQGDTIFISESDTTSDSDTTTNVENISGKDAPLTVYPNPASRYLYVEMEENMDIRQLRLHSINGRTVYSKANTGNMRRFRLNVEKLERGIYFLRIQTTSNEIVRRLIVQ
jgi:hypothetical protein